MSIKTDVVIIGAGPCGLFQVFELGLLGIHAHVVDTLPEIGGQCAALYPEKPIYDIPALPVVGARELVERLAEQLRPFEPDLHLGEMVVKLEREPDGAFALETSGGTRFVTRAVVVAGGLGSFAPRPLRTPGVHRHEGVNVEYKVIDKASYHGKAVAVLGGGDSALDWALELAPSAKSLTLVHRRDGFRAQPVSVERLRAMARAEPDRVRILIGRIGGLIEEGDSLKGIEVTPFEKDAATHEVRVDEVLVFYGLSPNLARSPSGASGWRSARSRWTPRSSRPASRNLRHRRHQHLPRQEEAHPERLPRSGARGVRGPEAPGPERAAVPPVHDHQPRHARAARGVRGAGAGHALDVLSGVDPYS